MKMTSRNNPAVSTFLSVIILLMVSCEEFVSIDPPKTQIVSATVYSNEATATSAMLAIYSEMIKDPSAGFMSGGTSGITLLAGFSSDELVEAADDPDDQSYFTNSLLPSGNVISSFWQPAYKFIYYSNAVLEGLDGSTGISDSVRKQLQGEAKFVRAICHFYLLNLFGDIPLVTTTDYHINSKISRESTGKVYEQVIADLNDARNLLAEDYSFSGGERVRPNKSAAEALLARVFLYRQEWTTAETWASSVIENPSFSLEMDLNNVFLAQSTEAIWQLMPVNPNANTWDGNVLILTTSTSAWAKISLGLLNAFEAGDSRKAEWIGSYYTGSDTLFYPFKYKVKGGEGESLSEYLSVIRLAEIYLVRAEARAQQNKLQESIQDLDAIRGRAGLPLIQNTNPLIDQAQLLSAIAQERRVELFAEWGHRWLDLKRTQQADNILGPLKGSTWQPTDVFYPIPKSEMDNDPNLAPQNPGY